MQYIGYIIVLIIGALIGWLYMVLTYSRAVEIFPEGRYDIELNNGEIFNVRNQPIKVLKGYLFLNNANGKTIGINLRNVQRITITKHS